MHYTERPINVAQAVELSGVCRRTLYHWMRDGFLPYTQRQNPRGSRLMLWSDVQAVMRARFQTGYKVKRP